MTALAVPASEASIRIARKQKSPARFGFDRIGTTDLEKKNARLEERRKEKYGRSPSGNRVVRGDCTYFRLMGPVRGKHAVLEDVPGFFPPSPMRALAYIFSTRNTHRARTISQVCQRTDLAGSGSC